MLYKMYTKHHPQANPFTVANEVRASIAWRFKHARQQIAGRFRSSKSQQDVSEYILGLTYLTSSVCQLACIPAHEPQSALN